MHLEGRQSVLSALRARLRKIDLVLLKSGIHSERVADILREAEAQEISVKYVAPEDLERITHGRTHGGIVALCGRKPLNRLQDLGEIVRRGSGPPLLLLLEGVEDGQHLGYALRSAEALGAHAVLLKKHLWDFDETTLSRTSSGAFERVALVKFSDASEFYHARKLGVQVFGCIANARKLMYEVDLRQPILLAVGGEKRGLSGAIRDQCDTFIRIPMAPGSASSLSLTHAACLLLGEAARQRLPAAPR